ncbi:MAG: hypothetical protein IPM21_00915 [Acidobacteria bacterium]|nr:hypothetical protein [Acidobacteriota bacterium]
MVNLGTAAEAGIVTVRVAFPSISKVPAPPSKVLAIDIFPRPTRLPPLNRPFVKVRLPFTCKVSPLATDSPTLSKGLFISTLSSVNTPFGTTLKLPLAPVLKTTVPPFGTKLPVPVIVRELPKNELPVGAVKVPPETVKEMLKSNVPLPPLKVPPDSVKDCEVVEPFPTIKFPLEILIEKGARKLPPPTSKTPPDCVREKVVTELVPEMLICPAERLIELTVTVSFIIG